MSVQESFELSQERSYKFQYIICVGSSCPRRSSSDVTSKFQYIICVGSSSHISVKIGDVASFNTSYVSVQGREQAILESQKTVSIHHMCRFKPVSLSNCGTMPLFQYIICVGSRTALAYNLSIYSCFNTSYVSVQENKYAKKR